MNAVYCGMNSCLKNYLSILPDWQGKSKIISKKHECNASSYCSNETRYQFRLKYTDWFFRNAVDGLKSWSFCPDYWREEKRSARVPFDLLEKCKHNALTRLCCIEKSEALNSSGKICRNGLWKPYREKFFSWTGKNIPVKTVAFSCTVVFQCRQRRFTFRRCLLSFPRSKLRKHSLPMRLTGRNALAF